MVDSYEYIDVNSAYPAWFKLEVQGKGIKKVTRAVADDARAGCPVDSGELIESIKERFPGELRGVVEVGTDHWASIEYGAQPHVIRSHGPWSLRSDEGEYFGPVVHHPGNSAQPFMRPALFRVRGL